MRSVNVNWATLGGLVISHEHSDHIKALPAALRKGARIYCTEGTAHALTLGPSQFSPIHDASLSMPDGLKVSPLVVSHDASEPCGFEITMGDINICVITDTGQALDHFLAPIRRANLLVLEANHDEQMLWRGPYPQFLKVRVASELGHLSNAAAGELLEVALRGQSHVPDIWLGHLSDTNNRPVVAVQTVNQRLGDSADRISLTAMSRYGGQRWSSDQRPARQLSLLEHV